MRDIGLSDSVLMERLRGASPSLDWLSVALDLLDMSRGAAEEPLARGIFVISTLSMTWPLEVRW